jgi:hypothetical protein
MTRVLRGVVHGKTIEMTEYLGMWEGQSVELIVTPSAPIESPTVSTRSQTSPKELPGPPPGWRPGSISTAAGLLAEEWTEQDDRILEQIHAERKAVRWRESPE